MHVDVKKTYIWEIWDLDERLKELHFSGFVEELCEATEENLRVHFRAYFHVYSPLFFIVMGIMFQLEQQLQCSCYMTEERVMRYLTNRSRKRSLCPRSTSGEMPVKQSTRWISN